MVFDDRADAGHWQRHPRPLKIRQSDRCPPHACRSERALVTLSRAGERSLHFGPYVTPHYHGLSVVRGSRS